MNQSDLNNIFFVLSLDQKDIGNWLLTLTDENELRYAMSIIECAHWYLLDEAVQKMEDCKQARKLLSEKFHAN